MAPCPTTSRPSARRRWSATSRRHVDGEVRFDATSRKLYSTDASIYQIEPLGVVIPKTRRRPRPPRCRSPPRLRRADHRPRRRHQPVRPVDRPRRRPRLQQVPERRSATSTRSAGRCGCSRASCSTSLTGTLAAHDLQFGPDVATASRANLGGMIGNNSAGARSIVYGKTIDHVRSLDVVLADGTPADVRPARRRRSGSGSANCGRSEGDVYRDGRRRSSRTSADEIEPRFPRILRRVSGYNLDALASGSRRCPTCEADSAPPDAAPLSHSLVPLLVGSEGTLAVVAEAELALVPRPKAPRPARAALRLARRRDGRPGRVPGVRPVGRRADGPRC